MFCHEKLIVYQVSLQYVVVVYDVAGKLDGHHCYARDRLLQAAHSIPLNIAEGSAKASHVDRRHHFEIACSSAQECAVVQDVLQAGNALSAWENQHAKELLTRIVTMLTRLCHDPTNQHRIEEDC